MNDMEKVINELGDHIKCALSVDSDYVDCVRTDLLQTVVGLLKAQEQRKRLEVHNIGNVDIPDCVTREQFYAVMNNVVKALEHTDNGESWPYDDESTKEETT